MFEKLSSLMTVMNRPLFSFQMDAFVFQGGKGKTAVKVCFSVFIYSFQALCFSKEGMLIRTFALVHLFCGKKQLVHMVSMDQTAVVFAPA